MWGELERYFDAAEILDAAMLCGCYQAISFTANSARVQREPGTGVAPDAIACGP
ncbi:MAG: hypothetical protein OEY70_16805 [Acidimicrobiia bacterium]|nr:hypothetical protein [Acidimicrobiia bacterium]